MTKPSTQRKQAVLIFIVVVSFIVGVLMGLREEKSTEETLLSSALSSVQDYLPATQKNGEDASVQAVLEEQVQAMQEFQSLIHTLQNPPSCREARLLIKKQERQSGFAREVHDVSRALQAAVATGRALVIDSEWRSAYEPPGCRWSNDTTDATTLGYTCLWQDLSKCSSPDSLEGPDELSSYKLDPSLAYGIVDHHGESAFFDVKYYGKRRVVDMPDWPFHASRMLIDVVPMWERLWGRFWIRSQICHYLWKPSDGLQAWMDRRMPKLPEKYIAFHIRYTDNIQDFSKHFGRDATVTRSFDRFMRFAEKIKREYEPSLRTIYISTDNPDIVDQAQRWTGGDWTFVIQDGVERSNATHFFWFGAGRSQQAPGIATDLEVLRRAPYLVGSFQSNVYRLAAELNAAYFADTYPMSLRRIWTVDVEWYEDP